MALLIFVGELESMSAHLNTKFPMETQAIGAGWNFRVRNFKGYEL